MPDGRGDRGAREEENASQNEGDDIARSKGMTSLGEWSTGRGGLRFRRFVKERGPAAFLRSSAAAAAIPIAFFFVSNVRDNVLYVTAFSLSPTHNVLFHTYVAASRVVLSLSTVYVNCLLVCNRTRLRTRSSLSHP